MKNTVKNLSLSVAVFLLSTLLYSCTKDSTDSSSVPPGSQDASLYLTDAPGYFDKVLIDIQAVDVLVDTCNVGNHPGSCNVWESLNVNAGVYDLLTLRNGTDTLLAHATIAAGNISYVKLHLGTNNSLVKDGITYPLQLRDSTVVLIDVSRNRWEEYAPRHFRLWVDFDVSRSIVNVLDNQFYLNPFIRVFTLSTTGSIQGNIWPLSAALSSVISIYNSSDTAYALPSANGSFQVKGLTAGTYNVFVNAATGYADTTISNVTVTADGKVQLGEIKLHQ